MTRLLINAFNAFNAWSCTDAAFITVVVASAAALVLVIGLGIELCWEIKNGVK